MSKYALLFLVVVIAVLLSGQFSTAQNETAKAAGNPFDGKVVIFNDPVAHPRQNVHIEKLAGREFFVYQRKDEDGPSHDYWLPADSVIRMRVFDDMKDATAFCEQQKSER